MTDFHNTLIESSKSLKESKLDKLDIPIISEDNAFVIIFDNNDYCKTFKISPIKSGLTKHNGQYYWFDHNILKCPKTNYTGYENHSYDIYPITEELAIKILNKEYVSYSEIKLSSFYYYGEFYTSVKRGGYSENFITKSKLSSGCLTIPYNCSPSDLKSVKNNLESVTEKIGEYLTKHKREYPKGIYHSTLTYNTDIIREYKLNEIFT